MAAASSHAARAEGSIGHVDGEVSVWVEGGWILVEGVFPMAACDSGSLLVDRRLNGVISRSETEV